VTIDLGLSPEAFLQITGDGFMQVCGEDGTEQRPRQEGRA
jgi:hypothetical protein